MMQNQANIFSLYINNQLQLSLTAFLNIIKLCLSTVRVSRRCLTNAQLKTGAFLLLRCLQHIQHMQISPYYTVPPSCCVFCFSSPTPTHAHFSFSGQLGAHLGTWSHPVSILCMSLLSPVKRHSNECPLLRSVCITTERTLWTGSLPPHFMLRVKGDQHKSQQKV